MTERPALHRRWHRPPDRGDRPRRGVAGAGHRAVQFAVVVLRYAFGIGSIWLSESVIYGHAAMFMLAAAWTLQAGGHVRVDIFYADASPRTKAMVDLLGSLLLLLPFVAVDPLVRAALCRRAPGRCWSARAKPAACRSSICSRPLIPLFAVLLGLQGIAQAIRAARVLARQHSARAV